MNKDLINIAPKINQNTINIIWLDDDNLEVGVFDLLIENNDAKIVGYTKTCKHINGFEFIKKSIDFVLRLGYSVVSIGNRSESAIKVWCKLEDCYEIKTIMPSKLNNHEKHDVKRIISKK